MKIEKVIEIISIQVETDEKEYYIYTRYSADNWMVTIGESEEPHYHCEEIEREFQQYLTTSNKSLNADGRLQDKPPAG